jgi:alkylation response protein AidB-like acyl-CoA dehydrogenase
VLLRDAESLWRRERTMNREISQDARILCDSVRKFMEAEVRPRIETLDHYPVVAEPPGFFERLVAGLGDLGLLSLIVPAELGGSGLGMELFSTLLETMAETYASVAALLVAHTVAQRCILDAGTPEQRERWLCADPSRGRPPLLGFPLYLEPDETAEFPREFGNEGPAGAAVEGTCELVVNAPIAEGLVLPVAGPQGTALIVAAGTARGVRISAPVLTLGLRGCPVADVVLEEARFSPEARIALEGEAPLKRICERFMGPVAAIAAGICGASLARAISYTKERRQGGRLLAEYSQVRMMIASMVHRHETARLASRVLSCQEGGAAAEGTTLFVAARDGAARAVQDGVQLLGGYGYMEEYGQERCMRDAKQVQMMLGRDDLRSLELATRRLG